MMLVLDRVENLERFEDLHVVEEEEEEEQIKGCRCFLGNLS